MPRRHSSAHVRPRLTALAILAGVTLVGCGGGGSHTTHSATTTTAAAAVTATTTTKPQTYVVPGTQAGASGSVAHFSFRSDALVTMRAYSPESLLWQTVSLNAQGAGVLTTLIGEQTGATQKEFHLSPRQAATLRRLVAEARTVRPPRPDDPRAMLYTLHMVGAPAENVQGHAPPQLTGLVTFLGNLMLSECC